MRFIKFLNKRCETRETVAQTTNSIVQATESTQNI